MRNSAKRESREDCDYQSLEQQYHALRVLISIGEELAQCAGITFQQHHALLAIASGGEDQHISVSELASRLMIRPHSAVGLVNRLVEQGLVKRGPSPVDRRGVLLELTRKGSASLAQLVTLHTQHHEAIARELRSLGQLIRRRSS